MPEPWEDLKDQVLAVLKDETKELSSDLKAEAQEFLKEQATTIAQETYRLHFGATEEEKEIARSNLRHLSGQRVAEVARLQLVLTARAENLFTKILSVAQGVAERVIPALLEKYAGKLGG